MPMFEQYPDPHGFPCDSPAMPTSVRDDEPKRRRRKGDSDRERDVEGNLKGPDREADAASSRDKRSHKISSSGKIHRKRSTSRERDRDRDRDRERDPLRSTISDRGGGSVKKKVEMVVPEMERRPASSSTSEINKPRTSYPSFSKAHSREAVGSMEEVRGAKTPFTPAATDVEGSARRRNSTPAKPPAPTNPPPSPPLTADNPDIRRSGSGSSMRDAVKEVVSEGHRSMDGTPRGSAVESSRSGTSLRREAQYGQSEMSSMPGAFPDDIERRTTPSSGYRRTVSTASKEQSTLTQTTQDSRDTRESNSTVDSGATTVPPERKAQGHRPPKVIPVYDDQSQASFTTDFSQPRTPIYEPPKPGARKSAPAIIDVGAANHATPQTFGMTPLTAMPPLPPPPPPPPPMNTTTSAPRVDYLLKNGGLPTMVPRRLVQLGPAQPYSTYQSPALLQQAPLEEYGRIFHSIHKRLDDYLQVLRTSGSLAVATGYKSVARRLLDKLSQVFARDISSVRCACVVCATTPQPALSDEEDSGISWGEILEIVSGRQQLPPWPPFSIHPTTDSASADNALGISTAAPMQKLDIDVPEEYKDHYIRQNQKTKRAVQSWLAQQPEYPSAPPEEADEDTLMFAMMTKLDVPQRNVFLALMHGQTSLPASRAPTPAERPRNGGGEVLVRAAKALQRLYRLEKVPRDCESAMYLLANPQLHGMLATLAEVNEGEWGILVSGRFDGFLWSGAEAPPFPPSVSQYASPIGSRVPSRTGMQGACTPFSRNVTPFSGLSGGPPSRGPTPFSPLRHLASPGGDPAAAAAASSPATLFPTRGATPASGGLAVTPPAPVQMDEDTEIAVLAEVERNLFNDMERFEDAFEILHSRAELVRQLLRERSAGLALQSQMRRGGAGAGGDADGVFVRLDTPASGVTDFEDEDDDGLGETASLAPDDSASQISVHRRHRRRQGRGTPAVGVVREEEEEGGREEEGRRGTGGPGAGGRRSKY
ncbi:hypothetical protein LTR53_005425 [Teratosphaeriaceae sp. CCFEE 6253]|nr:hypothetical protein LTR53_005425 [Teratosphaeriaceae sp. CCFEE 6253]